MPTMAITYYLNAVTFSAAQCVGAAVSLVSLAAGAGDDSATGASPDDRCFRLRFFFFSPFPEVLLPLAATLVALLRLSALVP